jgi:C1A family cysteine protease
MSKRVFPKSVYSELNGAEKVFDYEKYAAVEIPTTFDLRPKCPAVYDQGEEGSCTANAGCAARTMLAGDPTILLSRAFQYFMERYLEGDTDQDAGASMKDIGEALKEFGVCLDSDMPYVEGDYTNAPSDAAKQAALVYKISGASMVNGVDGIKTALVTRNEPVLCGMTAYESMESTRVAETGILPMPKDDEQILGGHAVAIVGYLPSLPAETMKKLHPFLAREVSEKVDKDTCFEKVIEEILNILGQHKDSGYFIVRNSWGADWGDNGYFYMPYEYVEKKFANEFWILENAVVASDTMARYKF